MTLSAIIANVVFWYVAMGLGTVIFYFFVMTFSKEDKLNFVLMSGILLFLLWPLFFYNVYSLLTESNKSK